MNFIDNFFNIDTNDISYITIKIKELFKKRFWKNKKRIKYFFNEINILLKEQYDLYTKKEWNGMINKLRFFFKKEKNRRFIYSYISFWKIKSF